MQHAACPRNGTGLQASARPARGDPASLLYRTSLLCSRRFINCRNQFFTDAIFHGFVHRDQRLAPMALSPLKQPGPGPHIPLAQGLNQPQMVAAPLRVEQPLLAQKGLVALETVLDIGGCGLVDAVL